MCRFCDDEMSCTPFACDVPGIDVEMVLDSCVYAESGRSATRLLVENVLTGDGAWFKVAYCPMCGRNLEGGA